MRRAAGVLLREHHHGCQGGNDMLRHSSCIASTHLELRELHIADGQSVGSADRASGEWLGGSGPLRHCYFMVLSKCKLVGCVQRQISASISLPQRIRGVRTC